MLEIKNQGIEHESRIQKWAPYLVLVVFGGAVAFYLSHFPNGLSDKQSVWGQFGDFVGGLVNPIIGFFTIWLLAVSLRQNRKALNQANIALAQAKAELELTRIAIEDSKTMQAATEVALKRQIEVAEEAKDMNNAIALMKHFGAVITSCNALEGQYTRNGFIDGGRSIDDVRQGKEVASERIAGLVVMIERERKKLVTKYGAE